MSKRTYAAVALGLMIAGTSLCAEERMKAGLWEMTTVLDGKSSGTHNSCFTPAMVELANGPASSMREATEKAVTKRGLCTLKDFKLDNSTISATMQCGAKTTATSSTYRLDAFETVATTTEAGATTVVRMKGRFLGPCK